jgi:hypothetical protein
LDTYYRRIERFLDERNVSISSYEQVDVTNDSLQRDINTEVTYRRVDQYKKLLNIKNDQELRRGCQQSCCWSQKKMKNFYNGEKDRYPTVLDRISQIDMKLLADLHYGYLPVPDGIQLSKLTDVILPCLQNNTVIFVDTTAVDQFFKRMHEKISVNYILITGDSDFSCPIPEVQNLPRAPPAGGGSFSFLGKFFIFREIFGVFLCEPLDLLLFKTGNFSNKFPRGRKFDRSAADSAPLSNTYN